MEIQRIAQAHVSLDKAQNWIGTARNGMIGMVKGG
jgi:hypothetical protein